MPRLFHVSDRGNILRFDPRDASKQSDAGWQVVWAIDESHLPNYLLPRDCPRVCFAASATTTDDDRNRFLTHGKKRVVAIEQGWLERVRTVTLYNYELSDPTFTLFDANAGYYISREPVLPTNVRPINNLLYELQVRNTELRVLA